MLTKTYKLLIKLDYWTPPPAPMQITIEKTMVFVVGAKMDTRRKYRAKEICQKALVLTAFETQEYLTESSGQIRRSKTLIFYWFL